MSNERKCKYCGKLLVRREKGGKVEPARDFRRRQFCDKHCSSKYQHSNKSEPAKRIEEAIAEVDTGTSEEKQTAIEVLEEAATDKRLDWTTRINAAKALLPYQAKKVGEKGGKKEEQAGRAKSAGAGRFCPAPPPKLVSGGKK